MYLVKSRLRGRRCARLCLSINVFALLLLIAGCGSSGDGASHTPTGSLSSSGAAAGNMQLSLTPSASSVPNVGSYAAAVPGPGCDTGGGIWSAEVSTKVQCPSDSAQISSGLVAAIDLTGVGNAAVLPQNYTVRVMVTPDRRNVEGAGISIRRTLGGGYDVVINPRGAWFVRSLNTANEPEGQVTASASYRLEVKVVNATATLFINGRKVGSFGNVESGTEVGLISYAAPARFKQFAFTPIS